MDYLLDTHAVIWFITNDKKLTGNARKIIENPINNCFVSIAVLWEIGIKFSLGRLDLKTELNEIFKLIEQSDFEILQVTENHILRCSKLEFHHKDPFDRLMIGQAISEKFIIITKDKEFKKYEVSVVW